MRATVALAAGLILGGCGTERSTTLGPEAPPSDLPAGSTLTVTSGETGAPLAGVRLVIAGREHRSDDQGRVRLESRVDSGTPIDVLGSAYLERQTLLRSAAETSFTLWPRRSPTGLDEGFTRRLIYTSGADGAADGEQALERIVAPSVAVLASAELKGDAPALTTLTAGLQRLTELTHGKVRYELSDRAPAGAVPVEMVVSSTEEYFSRSPQAVAFAQLTVNSRSEITRARIVFRELRYARRLNVAHHELGHILGLGHSSFTSDLMHCCSPVPEEMSARERLAVQLAYQRRPGNRYPDNDRDARSLAARGTRVLVCGGR